MIRHLNLDLTRLQKLSDVGVDQRRARGAFQKHLWALKSKSS